MTYKNETIINALNDLSLGCKSLINDKSFLKKYDSWIKKFIATIKNEGTIFICGNGGSFAHAQHLITELVVRFKVNREPIKAICLGSNQANLTAIGNDFSYEEIFVRELSAFYSSNDTVLILSTSGNSQNVVKVAEFIKKQGGEALALLGKDGGELKKITDNYIVPYSTTSLIQELHFLIGHSICNELEEFIFNLHHKE